MKVGNIPYGATADFGRTRPASGPVNGAASGPRVDVIAATAAAGRTTGTAPDAPAVATGGTDIRPVGGVEPGQTVHLSPESRSVASAGALSDGAQDIRQDKVDAIRQAIDDKSYRIDVTAIADKMIQEASQLLQTITSGPAAADGSAAGQGDADSAGRSRGRIDPPEPLPLPGSGELLPEPEGISGATSADGQGDRARDHGHRSRHDGRDGSVNGSRGRPSDGIGHRSGEPLNRRDSTHSTVDGHRSRGLPRSH